MTTLKQRLMPPLILLLILIGFFWKVTLTRQFTWLENPDNAEQVLPWLQMETRALHEGKLPLWDPYHWGGQSFIGQMQPGLVYPPNWLLFAAPLRDGHIRISVIHWYRVLLHWLAALFMYWLCRDLGRGRMASYIGGIGFAVSGAVGSIAWIQKLNGMIWIPLIFLFFLRALRGRQAVWNASLAGFFLGISWLSGHHQIPLYTTLVLAGIWIFHFYQEFERSKSLSWQRLIPAAAWTVFFAFTAAPQMLPAYFYGRTAMRWVGLDVPIEWNQKVPFTVHGQYSLGLFNLFGFLIPGFEREAAPYTGPLLLCLAAMGICIFWKETYVRLFTVLALAGALFSLGSQDVLYGIFYALVPMIETARSPSLAMIWANFGAAVLAAYGFDALVQNAAPHWPRKVAITAALAGTVLLTIALAVMMSKQLRFDYDDRVIGVAIWALLASALILAYQYQGLSSAALGLCALLLMLIDLGNVTGYYYVPRDDKPRAIYLKQFSENQDILEFLRSRSGSFRTNFDRSEISVNWGDWFGIEAYNGMGASAPANTIKLEFGGYRSRMLFGTRYYISRKPTDPDQMDVFTGKSGLKVYESPAALPRVWTMHQAVSASTLVEARAKFADPQLDLRSTAILEGAAPEMQTCQGSEPANLVRHDLDSLTISANMQCAGLVVLSDTYDSDWEATVDGKTAKIWPVDTAIRGVAVPAGAHEIRMNYRPASVYAGAAMFLIGLAGLFGLARLNARGVTPFEPPQP